MNQPSLDAVVAGVGDPEVAFGVGCDAGGEAEAELAGA
jgi:hypothetical protein